MIKTVLKNTFTKELLGKPFYLPLKDITHQFLHMDKLVLVKLILWKDLNIIIEIYKEVLFQDRYKKYFNILKIILEITQLLWSELHIYKFTTK